MRAISPTALSLWISDRSGFYLRYKCGVRGASNVHMETGLEWDLMVKRWLEEGVCGSGDLWDCYVAGGGLTWLESRLEGGACEQWVEGLVGGIPCCGKVDYLWDGGLLDWKVTGYHTKNGQARRRRSGAWHEIDEGWARQLWIYKELLGGGDREAWIHQLLWKPAPAWMVAVGGESRVGSLILYHGEFDSVSWCDGVRRELEACWASVERGDWGLPEERREQLDGVAVGLKGQHGDYLASLL